jgi:flagellar basal body-associated protein FliL
MVFGRYLLLFLVFWGSNSEQTEEANRKPTNLLSLMMRNEQIQGDLLASFLELTSKSQLQKIIIITILSLLTIIFCCGSLQFIMEFVINLFYHRFSVKIMQNHVI